MTGAGREAIPETVDLTADPTEGVPGERAAIEDVRVTVTGSRFGWYARSAVRRLGAASVSLTHLVIIALVSVPLLAWLSVCLMVQAPAWLTVGSVAALLFLLGSVAALLRTETDTSRRRR